MPNIISDYYVDELVEWDGSLIFYSQEIFEIEKKLNDVINRDTIPNIAKLVEEKRNKLDDISDNFYKIQLKIQDLEQYLLPDDVAIDDSLLNEQKEQLQNDLRFKMHEIEREFIDIKYSCYHFLAQTMRKQNSAGRGN